jgi:hypothetical protein
MPSYIPIQMADAGFLHNLHLALIWIFELAPPVLSGWVGCIIQVATWIMTAAISVPLLWSALGLIFRTGATIHDRLTKMMKWARKRLRRAILAQIRAWLKRVEDQLSTP